VRDKTPVIGIAQFEELGLVVCGNLFWSLSHQKFEDASFTNRKNSRSKMASQDPVDYVFKFIIIGDSNTGKSCLLKYFLEKKFTKSNSHKIGVEFGSKTVSVAGKKVKLQIWDTAGQERYRSVTRTYYRGGVGCLLVYDITSRDTYNHLASWLADARQLARADITVVVVGNKNDKKNDREVTLLEAGRFAQEHDLLFMETSAVTGDYVEEVFLKTAATIVAKIDAGSLDNSSLSPNEGKTLDGTEKKGGCC